MDKRKIMIIDDDEDFLFEIKQLLEESGYSVLPFSDADEAVEAAESMPPDLVFIDLKPGAKSGFEAAAEFSERPELCQIPIIAMSGYYSKTDYDILKVRCKHEMLIEKPIDPSGIVSVIEKCIGLERKK